MSNYVAKAKKALEEFRAAHPDGLTEVKPEPAVVTSITCPACPPASSAGTDISLTPVEAETTPKAPPPVSDSVRCPTMSPIGIDLELDLD
jgi:hypothetical protein